jgi:hypothetical protein
MDKKYFIYGIYFLMGLIDFSFSRKLGIEMILFTVILISIKIYSAYVGSITTLVVTSVLSIFLLYNNTNINYNHALQNNQENATKKIMLEQGIKNIDNQVSKYWLPANVLMELQNDRNKQLEELSLLSSANANNTTNPFILILTMSVIYICLILLVIKLQNPIRNPSKKKDIVEDFKNEETLPSIKEIPKEKLILEAKSLKQSEFELKFSVLQYLD